VGNQSVSGASTVLRSQTNMEHLQAQKSPQTSSASNLTPTARIVTYDESSSHPWTGVRDECSNSVNFFLGGSMEVGSRFR
jgi:hypothetical protein